VEAARHTILRDIELVYGRRVAPRDTAYDLAGDCFTVTDNIVGSVALAEVCDLLSAVLSFRLRHVKNDVVAIVVFR